MKALMLVLFLVGTAVAQMPATAPAPAPVDTAQAVFSWSSPAEAPSALTVWPDDQLFGQELILILDHASGVQPCHLDSLRVDVPWLELVPGPIAGGDLPLPPSEGARQLARVRIYREGPWQARWADGATADIQVVKGRVDDPTAVQPVRDPRNIGGLPLSLVVLAAVLGVLGLVALLWWRWRRRQQRWDPQHRTLGPPAWLNAVRELRDLEQASLLSRDHLDGLAGVLRRYLHGRFHLAAEEMTAPEVVDAARLAGWHHGAVAGLAKLLAGCDDARYAPARVGSHDVHQSICQALDLMDAVRIQPVWTPVAPADLADAAAAWDALRQRYPSLTSGQEQISC